jgi:hypothetical protein
VELVQPAGQPLGQAAGVDEHDRGAVLVDQLEQAGVHGGPDRAAHRPGGQVAAGRLGHHLAEGAEVLDGYDDLELERLAHPGVDHRDGPRPPPTIGPAEEAGDLLQRALRGRQPDALRRAGGDRLEPFEREGQVRAPLGRGHGVDLVDDHRFDVAQRLPGAGREHEVQRFRRGDEDVGRGADEVAPYVGRGVPGADPDGGLVHLLPEALRGEGDAPQWRAQVLVDVDGQGPKRGEVHDAGAGVDGCTTAGPGDLGGRRLGHEAVDAPEERGQRLARTRGREDQRVTAGGDGRPALGLRRRGRGEGRGEPLGDGRREQVQHGVSHSHNPTHGV